MKIPFLPSILCTAAFCLLTAAAEPTNPAEPSKPAKPATPLAQAKEIATGIHKAMDSMISAVEKAKDEKTAQDAADAILASTEKIQELAKSGRELEGKLTDADKAEMEKTMEDMNMAQYNERLGKAFMGLAEKPELMGILQPAIAAFTTAAMQMAADQAQKSGAMPRDNRDAPIRARDKGLPLRDRGNQVPNPNRNNLVE